MTVFEIEHQCPQCGAPANLQEADRLFVCPFCRVRSLLLTRDYFRYVLPAKSPAGRELVYFPYWRFKGTLLFSLPAGNTHKFVDVNQRAVDVAGIPATLGLRAQALKLRFVSPDMPGCFLPPTRSLSEAFTAFQNRFSQALTQPLLHRAHLGECMGLLYSPFYAKGRLYDAVLDTPLGKLPAGFPLDGSKAPKPSWRIHFVPALCPDCGWDLEGHRDALVMHCRNCQSSWYPSGQKLTRVESHCLLDAEPGLSYLPFWQLTCEVSDLALKTYGDLAQAAHLTLRVDPAIQAQEFRFWTPAFKLRAPVYLRLAESLTLTQPQAMLTPSLPPGRHQAVTLPVEEACESLKVILADIIKPRRQAAEMFAGIAIHPTHFRLTYLPFREDQHDYIQLQTQQAVSKNLLQLSRSL